MTTSRSSRNSQEVIYAEPSLIERFTRPFVVFLRALGRNRAGMIGFIGLVIYAVWIFIGPLIVPFDSQVRLDEIAAPAGSRDQLLVRAADANTYTSLASLKGKRSALSRKPATPIPSPPMPTPSPSTRPAGAADKASPKRSPSCRMATSTRW